MNSLDKGVKLTICFEVSLNVFLHLSELLELGETDSAVVLVAGSFNSLSRTSVSESKGFLIDMLLLRVVLVRQYVVFDKNR